MGGSASVRPGRRRKVRLARRETKDATLLYQNAYNAQHQYLLNVIKAKQGITQIESRVFVNDCIIAKVARCNRLSRNKAQEERERAEDATRHVHEEKIKTEEALRAKLEPLGQAENTPLLGRRAGDAIA